MGHKVEIEQHNLIEKYGNIFLKQGLDFLKKEEIKENLKEQYRTFVKFIFSELQVYIYIIIGLVFFIFIMLAIILFILVIRVMPFQLYGAPIQLAAAAAATQQTLPLPA